MPRVFVLLVCAIAALALPLGASATSVDDLSPFAGTGAAGFAGDGGAATAAKLNGPTQISAAPGGGYLIVDSHNDRIRRVGTGGKITTVAGTDSKGYNGDALPATLAQLNQPEGVAVAADGGILIADTENNRIREVLPGLGLITTVAGNGAGGYSGDGLAASLAELCKPTAVASLPGGGFLIADASNHVIRKVSMLGLISTVAGDGSAGYGGDGGAATSAQLNNPRDVEVAPDGSFLIADADNNVIRQVAANGTISTVAGDGSAGYSGDNDDPLLAQLDSPEGIDSLSGGGYLVADTGNGVVRKVKNGMIKTYAGASGSLNGPTDVFDPGNGLILVADHDNHRVGALGELAVTLPPVNETPPSEPKREEPQEKPALPAPDQPTVGDDLNVSRDEGAIKVKLPGNSEFVELARDASIPFGSIVDARDGAVRLTAAQDLNGGTRSAAFSGSLFKISQKRARRPVTNLELRGGDFDSCRRTAGRRGVASIAAKRRKSRRFLWGSGHGRFKTIGRHGAATVRGTVWLTADRCKGTLVRVRRGKVAVRDFRAHKTVSVRAGQSHFARANPRHVRRR